jgi:hypothetical protein
MTKQSSSLSEREGEQALLRKRSVQAEAPAVFETR